VFPEAVTCEPNAKALPPFTVFCVPIAIPPCCVEIVLLSPIATELGEPAVFDSPIATACCAVAFEDNPTTKE